MGSGEVHCVRHRTTYQLDWELSQITERGLTLLFVLLELNFSDQTQCRPRLGMGRPDQQAQGRSSREHSPLWAGRAQ